MEERTEHRRNRESRRWPYAFAALLGGTILGVLIVLAVRGQSVVVVNSGCCCCDSPCPPIGERVSESRASPIPVLPPPEPREVPPKDSYPPDEIDKNDKFSERKYAIIPPVESWRWNNPGGGEPRTFGSPTEIPDPGTLALIVGGVLAWRFS